MEEGPTLAAKTKANKQIAVENLKSGIWRVNYDEGQHQRLARYASPIWEYFGRVYHLDQPLNYVCCKHCRSVYTYVSRRGGTSTLLKHQCVLQAQTAAAGGDGQTAAENHQAVESVQNFEGETGADTITYQASGTTRRSGARIRRSQNKTLSPYDAANPGVPGTDGTPAGDIAGLLNESASPYKRMASLNNNQTFPMGRHGHSSSYSYQNKVELDHRVKLLQAETRFWDAQTRKTEEEIKKLHYEQLKLQRELGVLEVIEAPPEHNSTY